MKSGIHLFKLFNFEVQLDWSWFFLAILVTWSLAAGYFPQTLPHLSNDTYWTMGVIGAIGLFMSIILHELCHSLVGQYYGIPISGITLFIFGGVANMEKSPQKPKIEFLMALAGPLSSIGLGLFFSCIYQLGLYVKWPLAVNGVIAYLSTINFFLGIFNLMPGYPLDGGRVLRALLWWWKKDLPWATNIAFRGGVALGYTMVFFGILIIIQGAFIAGFWMFLLGLFIQYLSKTSYKELLVEEIFHGKKIKPYVKTNPITVDPKLSLQDLVNHYFYKYSYKLYPVVENKQLLGYITINDLQQINPEQWTTWKVRKIMHPLSPEITIAMNTGVTEALHLMLAQKNSRLIVTDHDNLYGVITLKDLMDVLSIRLNLKAKAL